MAIKRRAAVKAGQPDSAADEEGLQDDDSTLSKPKRAAELEDDTDDDYEQPLKRRRWTASVLADSAATHLGAVQPARAVRAEVVMPSTRRSSRLAANQDAVKESMQAIRSAHTTATARRAASRMQRRASKAAVSSEDEDSASSEDADEAAIGSSEGSSTEEEEDKGKEADSADYGSADTDKDSGSDSGDEESSEEEVEEQIKARSRPRAKAKALATAKLLATAKPRELDGRSTAAASPETGPSRANGRLRAMRVTHGSAHSEHGDSHSPAPKPVHKAASRATSNGFAQGRSRGKRQCGLASPGSARRGAKANGSDKIKRTVQRAYGRGSADDEDSAGYEELDSNGFIVGSGEDEEEDGSSSAGEGGSQDSDEDGRRRKHSQNGRSIAIPSVSGRGDGSGSEDDLPLEKMQAAAGKASARIRAGPANANAVQVHEPGLEDADEDEGISVQHKSVQRKVAKRQLRLSDVQEEDGGASIDLRDADEELQHGLASGKAGRAEAADTGSGLGKCRVLADTGSAADAEGEDACKVQPTGRLRRRSTSAAAPSAGKGAGVGVDASLLLAGRSRAERASEQRHHEASLADKLAANRKRVLQVDFDEAAAADGECVDLSRSSSDGEQDADADNHAVLGKGAYGGSKSKFRDKHKQRRRQAVIPLHKKHLGFDGDADEATLEQAFLEDTDVEDEEAGHEDERAPHAQGNRAAAGGMQDEESDSDLSDFIDDTGLPEKGKRGGRQRGTGAVAEQLAVITGLLGQKSDDPADIFKDYLAEVLVRYLKLQADEDEEMRIKLLCNHQHIQDGIELAKRYAMSFHMVNAINKLGLQDAIHSFPGITIDGKDIHSYYNGVGDGHDPDYDMEHKGDIGYLEQDEDIKCGICNSCRTHNLHNIGFWGKPALGSPIHRKRAQLQEDQEADAEDEESGDDDREAGDDVSAVENVMLTDDVEKHVHSRSGRPWVEFQSGGRCLGRVVLFHSLAHFKRRMLAACKAYIKRLRRRFQAKDNAEAFAKLMGDDKFCIMLYMQYKKLTTDANKVNMTENMKDKFNPGYNAAAANHKLHDSVEGEESDVPDLPESDDDSEEADGEDEEADEDGEAEEEEEEDEEVVEEPHTLPVQAVDERAGRQRGTSAEAGRSQRGRQRRQVQGLASDEEDGEAGLDAPVVSRRLTRGSVQASLPEVLGMSPDAMARLGAAQRAVASTEQACRAKRAVAIISDDDEEDEGSHRHAGTAAAAASPAAGMSTAAVPGSSVGAAAAGTGSMFSLSASPSKPLKQVTLTSFYSPHSAEQPQPQRNSCAQRQELLLGAHAPQASGLRPGASAAVALQTSLIDNDDRVEVD